MSENIKDSLRVRGGGEGEGQLDKGECKTLTGLCPSKAPMT